jgi:hypothetical protein
MLAVWGNGGRAPGSAREGAMDGARSRAESRTDGVDWALVVNTREFPTDNNFENLVNNAITGFLNTSPTL